MNNIEVDWSNYESPIQLTIREIKERRENEIWAQTYKIIESYDIKVDKDELIKALSYDRNQYEKGYKAGYEKGYHDARMYSLNLMGGVSDADS